MHPWCTLHHALHFPSSLFSFLSFSLFDVLNWKSSLKSVFILPSRIFPSWSQEVTRGETKWGDEWTPLSGGGRRQPMTMSRLMLGRTLERICKAVLLLCLVHFVIMMILYFDVYGQRFDIFSRFNNGRLANSSRWPHHFYYNYSSARLNTTFTSYMPASDQLSPSTNPEINHTKPTPKPVPPCPEVPPGLGRWCCVLFVCLFVCLLVCALTSTLTVFKHEHFLCGQAFSFSQWPFWFDLWIPPCLVNPSPLPNLGKHRLMETRY